MWQRMLRQSQPERVLRPLMQRPCAWQLQSTRFFGAKRGTVKWFNADKGYGFIVSEEQEYFCHYSNIDVAESGDGGRGFKSLAEGEEVEFDVETDGRTGRNKAVRVSGPGGEPVKGVPRELR
mmetsp:Transcript_47892/g.111711  ORF Transcript_47892/g.111711 Transcript_47892/m.111711 type:complete len:122 (-) Transcript_47892:56-421(-)